MSAGKTLNQHDAVYRNFVSDLICGRIRPGERLGEVSLAERWGVGRSIIRETLSRLEQDGLVQRKAKVGTFVREIDENELLEVYDVRAVLESLICRRVAELVTDEQVAELAEMAGKIDLVEEESDERADTDFAFHRRLWDLSRLEYAPRILRLSHLHMQCSRWNHRLIYMRGFVKQAVPAPDHRAIVQTLSRRDPDAAETVMREHLEAAKKAAVRDIEEARTKLKSLENEIGMY